MTTTGQENTAADIQVDAETSAAVRAAAVAAHRAAGSLARAPEETISRALRAMADRLGQASDEIRTANDEDMRAADEAGLTGALKDRLRLDDTRLKGIADQLLELAEVPAEPDRRVIRELPGGLVAQERRRPVGVIGANFEARPNVVADIASQLIKSRNAGVLRTGSAALRSAIALADHVVAPALDDADLDPAAIQLVRVPGQAAAHALVSEPELIPLVILRGSGASTRALAFAGARHGVRTLAHADGGAVMFVDAGADNSKMLRLIEESLDRLGVCNRLNLLLIDQQRWDELIPPITELLTRLGITPSLPPPRRRPSPTTRPPAWPRPSSPRTGPRWTGSSTSTRAPARSGTPAPGCWTASSCSRSRRPASTSTPCPARAARSPSATCPCASSWLRPKTNRLEGCAHSAALCWLHS